MTLDWLIIGGGIHGTHIAARLLADADVMPDRLRILDPAERLLDRWRTCTSTTGMAHLRSPSVHHLDLDPLSLQNFAGTGKHRRRGVFAPPYDRPSLALFNEHCDRVEQRFGLAALHIKERATRCTIECDAVVVELGDGRILETANLVLAVGAGEQPRWPTWAPRNDPHVQHVFDPAFDAWPVSPESVAVVGGGISAGHVAMRLLAEGHDVHLVSRHALRQHQFDSDPGWLGPKYTTDFSREPDRDRRRAVISAARHRGSVPPDLGRSLRRAIRRERIQWHEGEVTGVVEHAEGLKIGLAPGDDLIVDRMLLATGFASRRPGGSLVDDLVTSATLPCASCGYPIVDTALRWHPRVYVSGPLAELELGPVSRNIAGARRAGERIVDAVRTNPSASGSASR